eukprot:4482754-Heterocapsa_arctica.AAC.1
MTSISTLSNELCILKARCVTDRSLSGVRILQLNTFRSQPLKSEKASALTIFNIASCSLHQLLTQSPQSSTFWCAKFGSGSGSGRITG